MTPDLYVKMAESIIMGQEAIIGPVAVERAKKVPSLRVDWANHAVNIEGNESLVIDNLVEAYKELFGELSVEVCKYAAAKYADQLSPEQLPSTLR